MPEGPLDLGPDPRRDGEAEPHRMGGDHDVGVEDRGVDVVAADGLEGDLGGEIGVGDGVEDGAGAADGAVLGEGTARLTHEPDRDPVVGKAAAGADERVVVERAVHGTEATALG